MSADIQAVVAADYIRNLREESKKGFYGRLKQGVLPRPAPIGYLNIGPGKPKEIDPTTGPLVRHLFESYSTGKFNLHTLRDEANRVGLFGRRGKPLTIGGLAKLLNNRFYMGLIQVKVTGQAFDGAHKPLLSAGLFQRVQDVIHGRLNTRRTRYDFLLRRRLVCRTCGYKLIGETAKGHVYYRCHSRACPTTSIREEDAEFSIQAALRLIQFAPDEQEVLARCFAEGDAERKNEKADAVSIQLP